MSSLSIFSSIFLNTSRTFSVSGCDEQYNPIQVSQDNIKWSFEGVSGKFIANTFYPSSIGKGKIIAEVNGIKSALDITVLDYPTELVINKTNFPVTKSPQWIRFDGVDKKGFRAFINSNDLLIDTKDIISITDNYFRSKNEKSGIIKVSLGNVYSYFSVSSPSQLLDDFETLSDSFWGYPTTVIGSYSLSDEIKKYGNTSGKLNFDFSKTEGTKGAYVKLGKNGYTLDKKPESLSLWAYTDVQEPYSLKLELSDANGEIQRLTFSSSINWIGWKENIIKFDNSLAFPISIKKLYVVDISNTSKSGIIYFDKLQAIYSDSTTLNLPKSKKLTDYENKNSSLKGGVNSYKVSIFGNIGTSSTIILNKVASSSNKSSVTAFLGNTPDSITQKVNTPYVKNDKYNINDYKNIKFISICAKGNKNSIRVKDYTEWTNLFEELKKNTKDTIIINLDCSLDDFYDIYEVNLFKETLSNFVKEHQKNVWVMYPSKANVVINENGVKYIGIKELGKSLLSNRYLSITVNGSELTYMFKKLGL